MRLRFLSWLALASVAVPLVHAVTVVPPELRKGQTYRLMFVTSGARDATSTNIADYNAFVSAAANAVPELAALGTTWSVIGSTWEVSAHDNVSQNGPIDSMPVFNLVGERMSNHLFWDPLMAYATDEFGAASFGNVWTGSAREGGIGEVPLGHVEANPPNYSVYGNQRNTSLWFAWIEDFADVNSKALPFYGISGELTVLTDVPEPATTTTTALGALALLLLAKARQARA